MESEAGGELLPQEIVWEIVARLPVREILRARCVCSAWRDGIASPFFIRKHRQLAHDAGAIESRLLLAASKRGTVLLNPLRHDSWAVSPCFTHPEGLVVGAAGGLLCLHTKEKLDDLQLNFLVLNPITRESLRIPPLHVKERYNISKPEVTMVVRRGRLRMLAVNLDVAICVYDMFVSRESMEKRIANSGKLIYPLPNLWMELFAAPCSCKRLVYPDDHQMLACVGEHTDTLVDLNDFSVSPATRVAPAEVVADIETGGFWRLDPNSLSECTGGKLRVGWMGLYSLVICNLTFTATATSGLVCRHEPLLRVEAELPTETVLFAALPGDKMLFSYLTGELIRPSKVRRYRSWTETFIFSDVESLSSSSDRSRARVSRLKDAHKLPIFKTFYRPYLRLNPSLLDSPGSLPSDQDFTWDMVHFPREIEELPQIWATSFSRIP